MVSITPAHRAKARPAGAKTDNAIRRAPKKGDAGIRKIATRLGVGTVTVQKIKAQLSAWAHVGVADGLFLRMA